METTSVYERNNRLLERVRQGDSEAEAILVEENAGLVRSVARRFLDRGTEYEDLLQIGTIGMIASDRAKRVIGVELNSDAVRDARTNAKINNINNAEFYHDDATSFIHHLNNKKQKI